MKSKILFALTILGIALMSPKNSYAVACAPGVSGDLTIAADCSFSGTVNGVDSGADTTNTATLQINSGILTVTSSQQIGFGTLILNGGTLALPSDNTATLGVGSAIWMPDSDTDNYPESSTQTVSSSSPGAGYRRRAALTSVTLVDCSTNANAYPGQTAWFTADRGDGSFDYDCSGVEEKEHNVTSCAGCAGGCPATVTTVMTSFTGSGTACGTTGIASGPASCTRGNDGYGACITCTDTGSTTTTMECH